MADDYVAKAGRYLERYGINSYRVERRTKHRAFKIEHDGVLHTVIFPSTGSDRRGPANMVRDLRRVLNLPRKDPANERPAQKVRKFKQRAHRGHRLASGPCLDGPVRQTDKFFAPLERLRAQFAAEQLAAEQPAAEQPAAVSEPIPDLLPAAAETTRVRLRTPWLGLKVRYVAL